MVIPFSTDLTNLPTFNTNNVTSYLEPIRYYLQPIFLQHYHAYRIAIHSTEIKMPAGNGITCGVLRAGGFTGKNSL